MPPQSTPYQPPPPQGYAPPSYAAPPGSYGPPLAGGYPPPPPPPHGTGPSLGFENLTCEFCHVCLLHFIYFNFVCFFILLNCTYTLRN